MQPSGRANLQTTRRSSLLVRDRPTLLNDVIAGIDDNVLVRARLLSRAVTGIYDDKLQPFGISSAQFVLLVVIGQTAPTTRAEIARHQHLDKSTLTRNLRAILSERWVEEMRDNADGRSRPLALTNAGKELLLYARPAWLAAHAEAKALLGKNGMTAVIRTTDRIIYSVRTFRSRYRDHA
jgi:DNA-binding MarR family transcriptional regulator